LPAYLLTHQQIQTALAMAGVEVGPGSPLAALPPASETLQPAEPGFQKMAEGHLVETQNGGWRVNALAKAVLLVCAQPEEVISLRVTGGDGQGFSACRRGPLVSECSVSAPALVKLAFPLTRSAVTLMLTSALSGERPDAPPSGFRFRGRAEDAFVLSVLLQEARASSETTAESLPKTVAEAVEKPNLTLPFVLIAGSEPLLALARSRDAVDAASGRLLMAGHVRNDGGRLQPSSAAMEALREQPVAGFSVGRTLVGRSGPASQTLQRNIVFHVIRQPDGQPLFEWMEVTKPQLRALVGATLMDERELELAAGPPSQPAAQAAACPNCGAQVRPGQRFCRACGRKLTEEA
jgi:hypothetical protein